MIDKHEFSQITALSSLTVDSARCSSWRKKNCSENTNLRLSLAVNLRDTIVLHQQHQPTDYYFLFAILSSAENSAD